MKASDVVIYAAAGVAAYVGYKAYKKVAGTITSAGDGVAKVASAAVEVIKTDLNPASDQNLAYRAVSAAASAVTNDPSFNLPAKIWEWTHRDAVAAEKGLTDPVKQNSNVAQQAQAMQAQQENFRASEIKAQDDQGKADAQAAVKEENARTSFRLSEIQQESGYTSGSFINFLNGLQKSLYGGPVTN